MKNLLRKILGSSKKELDERISLLVIRLEKKSEEVKKLQTSYDEMERSRDYYRKKSDKFRKSNYNLKRKAETVSENYVRMKLEKVLLEYEEQTKIVPLDRALLFTILKNV
jgi:hypothetical protein